MQKKRHLSVGSGHGITKSSSSLDSFLEDVGSYKVPPKKSYTESTKTCTVESILSPEGEAGGDTLSEQDANPSFNEVIRIIKASSFTPEEMTEIIKVLGAAVSATDEAGGEDELDVDDGDEGVVGDEGEVVEPKGDTEVEPEVDTDEEPEEQL